VRCYRAQGGGYVWLPDADGAAADSHAAAAALAERRDDRRDYDVRWYVQALVTSYAGRLKKAFAPDDFAQLFRIDGQRGLFDRAVEEIEPRWVRCGDP